MRVQITARHCEISDAVRARTEARMERLQRYDPRISSAQVVFEEEKHVQRVECILSVDRDEPAVATGSAPDFRGALDQAADRLARILRRRRSRQVDHRTPPAPSASPPGPGGPGDEQRTVAD